MARIAIGGIQHETNTFASSRATFEEFVHADAWPGLSRGGALSDSVRGINIPIAGFIDQSTADRHQLKPLLWTDR
jgi:microcystin degradation protein MlrC